MKCKLKFCTCNIHGNCVYKYANLKCIRIARRIKFKES